MKEGINIGMEFLTNLCYYVIQVAVSLIVIVLVFVFIAKVLQWWITEETPNESESSKKIKEPSDVIYLSKKQPSTDEPVKHKKPSHAIDLSKKFPSADQPIKHKNSNITKTEANSDLMQTVIATSIISSVTDYSHSNEDSNKHHHNSHHHHDSGNNNHSSNDHYDSGNSGDSSSSFDSGGW